MRVYINIYLLNDSRICQLLHRIGLGAYHSSVTLGNKEFFYGYCSKGSGIGEIEYSDSDPLLYQHMYVSEVDMNEDNVKHIIKDMSREYRGRNYDILNYNCHIFTNDLCKRICGTKLPEWVNRLPRLLSSIPIIRYFI